MKLIYAILLLLFFCHATSWAQTPKVQVAAHRGDWRNYADNALEAIEGCIKMGVDMVEIDFAVGFARPIMERHHGRGVKPVYVFDKKTSRMLMPSLCMLHISLFHRHPLAGGVGVDAITTATDVLNQSYSTVFGGNTLADNGGYSQTIASSGTVAGATVLVLEAIKDEYGLARGDVSKDQRGFARPSNGATSKGAYDAAQQIIK